MEMKFINAKSTNKRKSNELHFSDSTIERQKEERNMTSPYYKKKLKNKKMSC